MGILILLFVVVPLSIILLPVLWVMTAWYELNLHQTTAEPLQSVSQESPRQAA